MPIMKTVFNVRDQSLKLPGYLKMFCSILCNTDVEELCSTLVISKEFLIPYFNLF